MRPMTDAELEDLVDTTLREQPALFSAKDRPHLMRFVRAARDAAEEQRIETGEVRTAGRALPR